MRSRPCTTSHKESLSDLSLIEGLLASGLDVVDIGLATTPMNYFAVGHLGTAGGIQVTASHNPAEYNGCKFSRSDAQPVSGASPRSLWPETKVANAPSIHALHGDADPVVKIAPTRELIAHLSKLGYDARLQEFPGLRHQISDAMYAVYVRNLLAAIDETRGQNKSPTSGQTRAGEGAPKR